MDIMSRHAKNILFSDMKEPLPFLGPVSLIFHKERHQLTWWGYPATLEAYIDRYSALVPYLADNVIGTPTSDAAPPEQTSAAISLQVCPSTSIVPNHCSFPSTTRSHAV